MPFKEYNSVRDPLKLPIGGKVYTIPEVGFDDGVRLTEFFAAVKDADAKAPELSDDEFTRILLGDVLDQLRADNAPAGAVRRAALTALADWQRGRETAEVMWETGGDPKALTRWTAAHKKTPAAGTTKRRASGSSRNRKSPSPTPAS